MSASTITLMSRLELSVCYKPTDIKANRKSVEWSCSKTSFDKSPVGRGFFFASTDLPSAVRPNLSQFLSFIISRTTFLSDIKNGRFPDVEALKMWKGRSGGRRWRGGGGRCLCAKLVSLLPTATAVTTTIESTWLRISPLKRLKIRRPMKFKSFRNVSWGSDIVTHSVMQRA